jgi:hypothetical protein
VLLAHRNKGFSWQSFSRRILLAFGGGRRTRTCLHMPKLPKACPIQQISTRRSAVVTSGMAPRTVGHRHCWATPHSTRKLQVCYSCSRIFLEMGRSQGAQRHHGRSPTEVLLAEHHLSLWCSEGGHSRQWQARTSCQQSCGPITQYSRGPQNLPHSSYCTVKKP